MSGEVQLPGLVAPDAPYVEFRANQCRVCGETGPVALVDDPAWWQWADAHRSATGHSKIFEFKIARSAGMIVDMPSARKPKRRPLGQR